MRNLTLMELWYLFETFARQLKYVFLPITSNLYNQYNQTCHSSGLGRISGLRGFFSRNFPARSFKNSRLKNSRLKNTLIIQILFIHYNS